MNAPIDVFDLDPAVILAVRAHLAENFRRATRGDRDRCDGYNAAMQELDTLAGAAELHQRDEVVAG